MKSVTISALKSHLSANLQLVRNGEEVLVCDRTTPIARIVPYSCDDNTEQRKRLIAKGILIPPKRPWSSTDILPKPAGKHPISREVMDQIWREERDRR